MTDVDRFVERIIAAMPERMAATERREMEIGERDLVLGDCIKYAFDRRLLTDSDRVILAPVVDKNSFFERTRDYFLSMLREEHLVAA